MRRNREGRVSMPGTAPRPASRRAFRPGPDVLEDRRLLTASLQSISNMSVPSQQGRVVVLDGGGATNAQTFQATSSNPDVAASVVSGTFWTLNVQYTDPSNSANNFNGALTSQLFQNLTPTTVNEISLFTNDGYYTNKTFHRIAPNFPNPADYILQGGSPNGDGTGNSGQPGTPFITEPVQQLAYTGSYQLGMARTNAPNSNDTQFFLSTGAPNFLSTNYTLFGQLVSGVAAVSKLTQAPTTFNAALGEKSTPVNPPVITSATLSSTNPNGALILDATQAKPGETATITVTATDSVDHTVTARAFVVTVGAYSGPSQPAINYRPFANPATATTAVNHAAAVTLPGAGGYPDPTQPASLTYSFVTQPAHGAVGAFDAAQGTFVYTPNAGYVGPDTFQYTVQSTGPKSAPALLSSNPATVSIMTTRPTDDFDNVGHTQLAVFRPSTTDWFVLGPSGGRALPKFGAHTDIPVVGDFDGAGHAEQAVYRPSTSEWFVLGPSGGRSLGKFGGPGDIPVPGDYDGIGKTELAVFRPSTAQWFVLSPGGGRLLTTFGATNGVDVPVPADFDGLGHAEPAVYRPSTSEWFVLGSNGGRSLGKFGGPTDVPVPGDYDSLGHAELAVFRPSTAQWFVLSPTGGRLVNDGGGVFGAKNLVDLPLGGQAQSLNLLGRTTALRSSSVVIAPRPKNVPRV